MSDLSLSPAAIHAACCGAGAAALDMREPPGPVAAEGPMADPEAFVRRDGEGLCHLDLMAENIHCADCIRKIERGQLEAATIRRSILLHLCGRGFGFYQIPRRSHDLRAVCRKSPGRLNSNARGHAGNENPFPMQVDPRQDIVCG